jgi:hypothetical protein
VICLPSGARVYDLRAERDWRAGKVGKAGNGPRLTPPKTGVMLHQTAVEFGVSAKQLDAAKGDRALALARRALSIGAHVTMFGEHAEHPPLIVLAAPFGWEVWHGNRANPETLGVEVSGRYEGVEGRRPTLWLPAGAKGGPTEPTPADIAGWREGLAYVVDLARDDGHPLARLYAHRQSSATRRSDPGSLLWRELGLWAETSLGLTADLSRTWADGRPVPREWDERATAAY